MSSDQTTTTTTPRRHPRFTMQRCETRDQVARCMAIRYDVFCVEQGYDPKIEVDELSLQVVFGFLPPFLLS